MKLNKLTALLCAAFIGVTSSAVTLPDTAIVMAQSAMTVTESGGYMEGMYAEWTSTDTVDSYKVYYKETMRSAYTQSVDAQLIRRYGDHYRVDAVGLAPGSYSFKIAAIKNGIEVDAVYTDEITVAPHKREGFAFSSASPNGGNASGGYNADGTVPSDAQIFYITQDNIDTITATIGKKTYKGLGNIIDGISKVSNPDEPSGHYIFRIIGKIDGDKADFSSGSVNEERHIYYLQEVANVTVEGIGDDATLYRCAFVIKGSSNVELRNLGVMLFLDDGIAIESDNSNIWVHNNDIFYGSPGADSDQVKGDGSLDIKDNSRYCTLSYNHFYDAGKASLVIASASKTADTTSYLTYHHNHFDHSDSRHPRIRFASVHMYNNYYDGIAKYGTGVTSGASAFVEANYYRNPKSPMLSSMQGNDSGTFSKEAGGIIKAYNNYYADGEDPTLYYSADTGSDFDAYLASSRDEQIPATVKTKLSTFKGITYNNVYNNFDTASDMYEYTPDAAKDVAAIVEANAGRVNGGDFKYDFGEDADRDSDIDETLKKMLTEYESGVVATYTGADGEYYPALGAGVTPAPTTAPTATPTPTAVPTPTPTPTPTATPEPGTTPAPTAVPTETPVPATELSPVTEKTVWTYENAAEEYTDSVIFNNSKIHANSSKNINLTATKFDTSVASGLKLNGGGVPGEYRCVEILPGVEGTISVSFENTSSSARTLMASYGENDEDVIGEEALATKGAGVLSAQVSANKPVYIYSKSSSLTICSITFEPSQTVTTPEPTPTPTPEVTATPTPSVEPTDEPTPSPSAEPEYPYTITEVFHRTEGTTVSFEGSGGGVLVVAAYNEDGRLLSVNMKKIEDGETSAVLKAPNVKMIYAYIWEDIESMKPISKKKLRTLAVACQPYPVYTAQPEE